MLKTAAIIEPNGTIRTLEPLQVEVSTKAIVTLLTPVSAVSGNTDIDDRSTPKYHFPIPELAGKVKIVGDIVGSIANEEDWECLK
jgi:hypothetical protein